MHPPGSKSVQLDLFGPLDGGRPSNVPRWRSLRNGRGGPRRS